MKEKNTSSKREEEQMNLSVVMNYPAVRNKRRLVSTPDS
jgi:hypothetical protein